MNLKRLQTLIFLLAFLVSIICAGLACGLGYAVVHFIVKHW